jgi:hypothetical protein
METKIPYPANVPGDFYVEDGCCTSCNMPFTVAPDLFASSDGYLDGHCYVSKQPKNPEEVHRMMLAIEVADTRCIRYKGHNRVIKIHLISGGEGDQCDHLEADLLALNQEVKADRWGLK